MPRIYIGTPNVRGSLEADSDKRWPQPEEAIEQRLALKDAIRRMRDRKRPQAPAETASHAGYDRVSSFSAVSILASSRAKRRADEGLQPYALL